MTLPDLRGRRLRPWARRTLDALPHATACLCLALVASGAWAVLVWAPAHGAERGREIADGAPWEPRPDGRSDYTVLGFAWEFAQARRKAGIQ